MITNMIDLDDLFNPKYKYINNLGIGAVSIITQNQMVTRFNEGAVDEATGKFMLGLGRHEREKFLILEDIFSLPKGLEERFRLRYDALEKMNEDQKKVLDETVEIYYSNSSSGNTVLIKVPKRQNSLTTNQLNCISKLIDNLIKTSKNIHEPIMVWVGNSSETISDYVTNKSSIMQFLQRFKDDNYVQSVQDVNFFNETEGIFEIKKSNISL